MSAQLTQPSKRQTRFAKFAGLAALLVVVGLLLIAVPSVFAKAETSTQTVHNETETFVDTFPCDSGTLAEITITYNGVFHETENENGTHFTFTQTGTFEAIVAGDPASPYTGKFTIWGGSNDNRQSEADTFTFTVHLEGSDGSVQTAHITEHFNVSANGEVNTFSKLNCS